MDGKDAADFTLDNYAALQLRWSLHERVAGCERAHVPPLQLRGYVSTYSARTKKVYLHGGQRVRNVLANPITSFGDAPSAVRNFTDDIRIGGVNDTTFVFDVRSGSMQWQAPQAGLSVHIVDAVAVDYEDVIIVFFGAIDLHPDAPLSVRFEQRRKIKKTIFRF